MVYTCCICKWRADKKPPRSFHKFPTKETYKQQWLEIVNRINGHLGSRPVVCSLHFEKECFRYGAVEGRAFLKQGSLPTLYLSPESAETIQNSVAASPSPEIRSEPSAEGINSYDSAHNSSLIIEECCSNCEITIDRNDDIFDERPCDINCMNNPIESALVERIREFYMGKLREKMKIIFSLRRQNRRLCESKLNMIAQMTNMKVELFDMKCINYIRKMKQ